MTTQGLSMRGASLTMLVRRIKHEGVHAVVSEVTVRSRRVVVLEPGTIPKTPSGKLRRATSHALLG